MILNQINLWSFILDGLYVFSILNCQTLRNNDLFAEWTNQIPFIRKANCLIIMLFLAQGKVLM